MNKYLLLLFLPFCFLACTNSEGLSNEHEGVEVTFSTRGIVAQVASTRADASPLGEGATIRVQVYKHTGTATDLTATNYVGDNTYVVGTDGSLSACIVDATGTVTSTTGNDLYLRSGDYDFYTVTPALTLSTSGETTAVAQGMDYATSLTQGISVSSTLSTQSVTLTTLERKCSQLVFNIDRAITTITSVAIDELTLTGLAVGPLTGTMNNALSTAASNTGSVTLSNSNFTYDATDQYKASASTIVLPKTDGSMQLSMTAYFNGHTTARTISSVTVPSMAFEAGTQYIFTLKLYGDQVVLSLTSSSSASWETATSWSAGTGDGTLKNLSINSSGAIATANCYVVNTANQDYKFKATVMGNGATTPAATSGDQTAPAIVPTALSPATAFVIWETGSKGNVIQDGSVKIIGNGYVIFKTANNSTNGNALIGVKDASGTLLWSWHIWKVDYDPDTDYDTYKKYSTTTTFKMIKYNLGATEISNWSGTATNAGDLGLYYQWGRKDPFVGAKLWTTTNRIDTYNSSGYTWLDGTNSTAVPNATAGTDAATSIAYSIKNPTHFIVYNTTSEDWLNVSTHSAQRDNLWGNPNSGAAPNTLVGSKSIYDPCPPGWRVPTQDSYQIFSTTGTGTTPNVSGVWANGCNFYIAGTSGNGSFWPASGSRNRSTGVLLGFSSNGYSWSSSPFGTGNPIQAGNLGFSSGNVYPLQYSSRSYGGPVRCAQE
ncbi:BF2992 family fimbrillin-A clan protein [Bacteroides ihuae]|uniref:BF2992 family fimbrillin-A clan protein n=1 Tax=Bacteroides ihuae TaxID=1852362 RepID=UPI0008DA9F5C|nr:fimbrillin family protein [Bacteroides ihuae]